MTTDTNQTDWPAQDLQIGTDSVVTTVLLVDDDDDFALLVAEYLEREHGFDVRTETSADAALERLDTDPEISCVVSNYAMPGMDGLELLDAAKSRHSELPFILFAGQGSEEVASRAIRLGADDYLTKQTATLSTNCWRLASTTV